MLCHSVHSMQSVFISRTAAHSVAMDSVARTQSNDALTLLKLSFDIDRLSEYIDRKILTFRYLPYAVGVLGVAVLFRSIRLTTKFTKVSQLPHSFIRKNVQLRGKITNVNLDGTLEVEHLPIVLLPWHGLYKKNSQLNVRMAFTSPTIPGIYWMRLNVSGKAIKFQLLDRNHDKSILWASVKAHLLEDSKLTLNETLVRKGLAKVTPVESEAVLSKAQAKVLKKLEMNQAKAHKEGLGIWNDDHQESWLVTSMRIVKEMLRKI